MPFELAFHPEALREWRQLIEGIRTQFKKKLAERLDVPRIPASKPRGSSDRYKIKLRSAGFRLVYEVRDHEVLVLVVAVGKRERNAVYRQAELQQFAGRLHRQQSGKTSVRIIDWLDLGHPITQRMWERRLRGYRAMGYALLADQPSMTGA